MTQISLNLIIPFKDNKGEKLEAYLSELFQYQETLFRRADELQSELDMILDDEFEMRLVKRKLKNGFQYSWRFKSSKKNRTPTRLSDPKKIEYLKTLHHDYRSFVVYIESNLLPVNSNLDLVSQMIAIIENYKSANLELENLKRQISSIDPT